MKRSRDDLEEDEEVETAGGQSWGWGGWSAGDSDAAELTRQIGAHALEKRLPSALSVFAEFEKRKLKPTAYTFSNLINAHVMAGDVPGGALVLERMASEGFPPNTIAYTTLLKGYCLLGDLEAAKQVLLTMAAGPMVGRADARTLNTFMRGCVRAHLMKNAQTVELRLP